MRSSAYEHIIPERLFSTEDNPAEGVSTAKALSLAMAQGQKIYTLTTENKGQLANITIDDNARSEISQALTLGLEVTVHERPINVNGWEGSGYSIIDTDYGVGAYKISGGASGGSAVLDEGQVEALSVASFLDGLKYTVDELLKKGPIPQIVSSVTKMIEGIKKCDNPYTIMISMFVLAALLISLLSILIMAWVYTALMAKIIITAITLVFGFVFNETIDAMIENCPKGES